MPVETLVDGYTYLVVPDGSATDIDDDGVGGLYHRDTRYLSALRWTVDGGGLQPLQSRLLSPAVRRERLAPVGAGVNDFSGESVPKHTDFVVTVDTAVREGAGCSQTLTLHNYGRTERTLELDGTVRTDFADLFEVRGLESGIDREVTTAVDDDTVTAAYSFTHEGRERSYETTVSAGSAPTALDEETVRLSLRAAPGERASRTLRVGIDGSTPPTPGEIDDSAQIDGTRPATVPVLPAERDAHEAVLEQAAADLRALTTETPHGPVPLAGTPWFVTPFGRDALITAYQTLPVAPGLARGTLRYLAAHRGEERDPVTEAEPGKILHEQRHGELAVRGRIPHTPYYGTVDATPLWVLLLAETCLWEGSFELAAELAEPLAEAVSWIHGATENHAADPFVYYEGSENGLSHKAWKDTADSIRYADGEPASGPLAVAEVQGYVARALTEGARLLEAVGGAPSDVTLPSPETLRDRASDVRGAFHEEFWLPERSFYAVAKAGDGTVVDSLTSNVGHCLWTGLVARERADAVVETLLDDDLSGGWGLRTMSAADAGYSPVSYHAGGVWPHDTSLAVLGLDGYGYQEAAERLGRAVLDAAASFRNARLPELYCGFPSEEPPAPYPAACTPQAWGAGAPFAILRASFGLEPGDDGTPRATRESSLFVEETLERLVDAVDASETGPLPPEDGEEHR